MNYFTWDKKRSSKKPEEDEQIMSVKNFGMQNRGWAQSWKRRKPKESSSKLFRLQGVKGYYFRFHQTSIQGHETNSG